MDVCICFVFIILHQILNLFLQNLTFTKPNVSLAPSITLIFLSPSGLAYCRHLSTVRTHLSGLVNHAIVEPNVPTDAYKGLTTEVWMKFLQDCSVSAHTQTHLNEPLCQTLIHIHLSLISHFGSIA